MTLSVFITVITGHDKPQPLGCLLGHSLNASEAVSALTQQLDTAYRQVAKNFADNQAVSLDFSGKRPKLTIANLNGLDESPTLKSLAERVSGLLPVVDLTELLLEINAHTGFAEEFTHASEEGARMEVSRTVQ